MFLLVRKLSFFSMSENQSCDAGEQEMRSYCRSLPPDVGEKTDLGWASMAHVADI